MKDPKRIERVLKLVEEIWTENPEWRLTQLIMNALALSEDPYYVEDGVLEDALIKLRKKIKK